MEIYQFILEHLNYGWIWFLMLLESTVIPVPSEFVVPPAAYFAATGHLNVWLVILAATLGADCGATINYFAGRYLGRPIIYKFANSRWGHLCLLNQEKVEKSERYFNDHGVVATLTGRFVPVIRHLISIPAGMARMGYWKFLFYTTVGAGLWHCVLAALGWYLQSIVPQEQLYESLGQYGEYIKIAILSIVGIVAVVLIGKHLLKKKQN
ncbi:MAG: DedA family protein [Prevotella sp.]|nr:DedA family protein [Prevotella sp.]